MSRQEFPKFCAVRGCHSKADVRATLRIGTNTPDMYLCNRCLKQWDARDVLHTDNVMAAKVRPTFGKGA